MSETTKKQRLGAYDQAVEHWEKTYAQNLANERPVYNRSGIEIDPLYLPGTDPPLDYVDRLGLPGQTPYTRGIYSTCLLYTSPSPRDQRGSRMPSSA